MKKNYLFPAIALGALFLALFLSRLVPAFHTLELKTVDWRFAIRGATPPAESPVVLVAIDDASFESLPDRWPWPRWYFARAVENLTAGGARAVGIDVMLDRPDMQNPGSDSVFAGELQASKTVVLARKLERHTRQSSYQYLVEPIDIFKNAQDVQLGLVSVETDADGIYRRYPVVQLYQDRLLTSFALELIRKYRDYDRSLQPELTENGISFGDYTIPFYDASTMLINFAGPRGSFPQYSLSSVIDDERLDLGEEYDLNYFTEELKPGGVFANKIVIIGSTVAELHDNFPTPYLIHDGQAAETPGAEILANAVNTILSQEYYRRVSSGLVLLLTVLLLGLIVFLNLRLSPVHSTIAAAIILLLFTVAAFYLFLNLRVVMEMVFPLLTLSLAFIGFTVYNYYHEQRERKKVVGAFTHYVPPKVVQELMNHPEKLQLGGEERVISMLFSDVVSFTTIAEQLSNKELVRLINDYLTEMTNIILKHDGIIDKYEGDAIMAEFGVPIDYPDHPLKCCLAALEMQKKLRELSHEWRRVGRPTLMSRIGINTGNVLVGNMGSDKIFDYTVLGDEVNLAARLEGANKVYGTQIMISESTYNFVKDALVCRPLDRIIVKGKSKPVQVYELIAKKGEKLPGLLDSILPLYSHGIQYYDEREWANAESSFRKCLRLMPDDGPSQLYLKRVQEFAKNPPPPNWNRVYELKSK